MHEKKTRAQIKEKFAGEEFPINIVGRHNLEITDPIRDYAVDKLLNIKRFGGRVIEANIILEIQKAVSTAEYLLYVNNTKIFVVGRSSVSLYAAIDEAIGHLQRKLTRYITRLHEHHKKPPVEVDMNVNVLKVPYPVEVLINDQIDEENSKKLEDEFHPHELVSREQQQLKILTVEEAVMKMDLSDDLFLVFRCEEDQKLKVIYRREDGHYALMEPE